MRRLYPAPPALTARRPARYRRAVRLPALPAGPLLLLLAAGCGCATLAQGSAQYVSVAAHPPGALARAGEQRCETPCSLRLPRSRPITVEVEAEGYAPAQLRLEPALDPLLLGNFCLPPLFPLWAVVDLWSGAGYRLEPAFLQVSLRPETRIAGGPPVQPPSSSWVSTSP